MIKINDNSLGIMKYGMLSIIIRFFFFLFFNSERGAKSTDNMSILLMAGTCFEPNDQDQVFYKFLHTLFGNARNLSK